MCATRQYNGARNALEMLTDALNKVDSMDTDNGSVTTALPAPHIASTPRLAPSLNARPSKQCQQPQTRLHATKNDRFVYR